MEDAIESPLHNKTSDGSVETHRRPKFTVGPALVMVQPRGRTLRPGAESTSQRILFRCNVSEALGSRAGRER